MAARNKTFGSILGLHRGRRKGTHKFRGATRSRDCARNYGHLAGTERRRRRRRRLETAIAISARMNYLVGEPREFFGAADARQVTTHCLEHSRGMKWFHGTASGCLLCPGFPLSRCHLVTRRSKRNFFDDSAAIFFTFFIPYDDMCINSLNYIYENCA